jgi:WD40 repeat protein/serine/threonine protein kinase/tetratricopeptide (TPR) repeat protein
MAENIHGEESIFLAALQKTTPEERQEYVDGACCGSPELRRRVVELLKSHDESQGPFDVPLPAVARTLDMPAESPTTEKPGTVIGPYKLLQQIGEGGMGTVYMAEQAAPVRRKVALKIIKPGMDTREVIARFEAERQALALMDHPNIARVFDGGTTAAGRPYFVMEIVRGVPITDYCDQNNLPVHERLELFVTVCHAVQHAHQKGIIHRDIKPSNVLVTLHDGHPLPKVIDFGVAKAIGQQLTDKTLFTQFAQMVGTPLYMSPEQAELTGLDIDTRGDIYSLGVMLYELLTGTTPFERARLKQAALDEIRRMIREEDPPSPSARLSSTAGETQTAVAAHRRVDPRGLSRLVRGDLDWIVMKALEKDRSRRYETANGFAADIGRYLSDEPVEACPPSAMYRFRKFARRNKGALTMAAALFSALLLATIGLAVSNVLVRAERNEKIEALGAKEKALGEKQVALGEKETALTEAKANYTEAKRQEGIAQQQEVLARRRFYAAQMILAMQAWRASEAPRALELLEGQRPGEGEEDLRGFEWYYLWRLCNSGRGLYLHGHTRAVLSVAFSPDGMTLASASWDGTVGLWDAATGKTQRTLRGHSPSAWAVAFSPDGKTLASGGKETGSLILWDASSGQPLLTIRESVDGMAFSPDSRIVAGGAITGDGVHVKLWDVGTGAVLATFADAGDAIGFLADGKTLVTLTHRHLASSEIQFWDVETGTRRLAIPLPGLFSAALSPDGTQLATSSMSTPLRVWDTATGKQQTTFPEQYVARGLAFSPDGKKLATGSEMRTVTVWDVQTGRRLVQDTHLDPVWSVAFSPDGKKLASSTLGGAIKVWDMAPPEEATTIPTAGGASLRFSPDGRTLLVGSPGPTKLVDVAAGKEVAVLPASGMTTISADANVLAGLAGADRGTVWEVRTGREIANMPFPHGRTNLTLSPDGKRLAEFYPWSDDNKLKLWDVATQQARILTSDPQRLNRVGSVASAEFSPDGKMLAAGLQFQWVTVWDVTTGEVKLQFSPQKPAMMNFISLAFSPDNKALAVGTDVGAVTLWEVETGMRVASFKGHTFHVYSLAFSPDGKTLATAGADKTVRLWDVLTGQERCTLTGHSSSVGKVLFSPDGKTLATASGDGTVKLWRAATDPEAVARRIPLDADDPNYQVYLSAWVLATSTDPLARNPAKAVDLARKLIVQDDRAGRYWLMLGIAQYGARQWQEAITALEKTEELAPAKFTGYSGFVRALAHWQLEHQDEARKWYERAAEWTEQKAPGNSALRRFQVEAAELLGLPVDFAMAAQILNNMAWSLATCPDAKFRDAERAVELAKRAVVVAPRDGPSWNTLGVAHYCARNWAAAIDALQKSRALQHDKVVRWDAFFLAMAHWQLGSKDDARQWYDQAVEWMDKYQPQNEELHRFRVEAAGLLGLAAPSAIPALPPGAISRDEQVKELLRQLAAIDKRAAAPPKELEERWKLAREYFHVAQALQDFGERTAAEAGWRKALEQFVQLSKEDCDVQFPWEAGWAGTRLADLLEQAGRFQDAIPIYRDVVTCFQSVADKRPDQHQYRDALAGAYMHLARLAHQLDKSDEADQAERAALASRRAVEELRTLPKAEELLAQARPFAEKRDWKQAAAELNKGFERQTRSDLFLCYSTALARLLAGDVEGYTRLIDQMSNAYSRFDDALDLLRTRTLHSRGAADSAALVELAQAAYNRVANNWSSQNLGMAHYRAGKFDQALVHIEEALKLGEWYLFYPALAMTHHQLGHADEARQWLDKANAHFRHVTEASPQPVKATKEPYWQDWAYFEVLRLEAKALIERDENK